jgi:hypothetical protein
LYCPIAAIESRARRAVRETFSTKSGSHIFGNGFRQLKSLGEPIGANVQNVALENPTNFKMRVADKKVAVDLTLLSLPLTCIG